MTLHSRDAVTVSAAVATRSRADCSSMEGHTSLSTALVIRSSSLTTTATTTATTITTTNPSQISRCCITSCAGLESGDYQSCHGCNVYVSCTEAGLLFDNRPCAAASLAWDDIKKSCEFTSSTWYVTAIRYISPMQMVFFNVRSNAFNNQFFVFLINTFDVNLRLEME